MNKWDLPPCRGWAWEPAPCKSREQSCGGRTMYYYILSSNCSPSYLLTFCCASLPPLQDPGSGCKVTYVKDLLLFIFPLLLIKDNRIQRNTVFLCNEWKRVALGTSVNGFDRILLFLTWLFFSSFISGSLGFLPGFFLLSEVRAPFSWIFYVLLILKVIIHPAFPSSQPKQTLVELVFKGINTLQVNLRSQTRLL